MADMATPPGSAPDTGGRRDFLMLTTTAFSAVGFDCTAQVSQSGLIEAHSWFIEKPNRALHRNQARE